MLRRLCKRGAFTLVELLVVIAIIGILIALLLPAVQAAREAARRAQCTNNAKQLALALHNYHDVYKMFPLNYGGNQTYAWNCNGHSWMTGILPFVEQQPLWDQIDWDLPLGDVNNVNVNTTVAQTVIPAFLCPSDSNQGGIMIGLRNVTNTPWAVNNYKACAGGNWAWGDAVCHFAEPASRWPNDGNGLDRGNGIICRNSDNRKENWTRLANIEDGTSNTFAVGEAVPRWCTHTHWWWFNGATATCGIPLNYVPDSVRNDPNRTLEINWDDWGNNYSFMSRHPGGANFALCDGSVRFIMDTIDITTYRHLANMTDGQPVALP